MNTMRSCATRLVKPIHVVLLLGIGVGGILLSLVMFYGGEYLLVAAGSASALWLAGLHRWWRGSAVLFLLAGDLAGALTTGWVYLVGRESFSAWILAMTAVLGAADVTAALLVVVARRGRRDGAVSEGIAG